MAFYRPPGGTAGPGPMMKPPGGLRPRGGFGNHPDDMGSGPIAAPPQGPPDIQAVLDQQRMALGRKPPMVGGLEGGAGMDEKPVGGPPSGGIAGPISVG